MARIETQTRHAENGTRETVEKTEKMGKKGKIYRGRFC